MTSHPFSMIARFTFLILLSTAAAGAAEPVHAVFFPEGDAAWSVVFEGAAANARKRVDIVRQGPLRLDAITVADGAKTLMLWSENPSVVLFDNGTNGRVSSMKASGMEAQRYDASSFAWVGSKSFAGMKSLKSRSCQYYETTLIEGDAEEQTRRVLRAWIDAKTRRPVALDNGSGMAVFSFATDPAPPLEIPERFLEKLKRQESFNAPAPNEDVR